MCRCVGVMPGRKYTIPSAMSSEAAAAARSAALLLGLRSRSDEMSSRDIIMERTPAGDTTGNYTCDAALLLTCHVKAGGGVQFEYLLLLVHHNY